jgi:hypothetical protein
MAQAFELTLPMLKLCTGRADATASRIASDSFWSLYVGRKFIPDDKYTTKMFNVYSELFETGRGYLGTQVREMPPIFSLFC